LSAIVYRRADVSIAPPAGGVWDRSPPARHADGLAFAFRLAVALPTTLAWG
jgi:hypothetical protein